MKTSSRRAASMVIVAVVFAGSVDATAAQESKSMRELAQDIEAQLERHAAAIARAVEEHFSAHEQQRERDLERQEAERARQQARQAAQQQRERAREEAARQRQRAREQAERAREQARAARERSRRGPEVTEAFSRTVRLGRNGTFDLQNVGGDIVITGGRGDEVRIDATKRARHANDSEARAILKELQIHIAERGGNVEVRTEYPRQWRRWSGGVDYKVALPRNANVTLKSISGNLRMENIDGELRAETVSGDLVATSTRRVRLVKSMSGDVQIVDAEGDEMTAGTVSGDLVIRNTKARLLDLQSVSGDMRFEDVEATRANVRSLSGDIDYRGPLARSGRYEFQSYSGDVRVMPVGAQGFALEATTFSGNMRSDYALTLQGELVGANNLAPRRLNRTLRGSFGNGSATLSLQSFSGDIVVAQRASN